jgi:hypothetical protein
MATILCLCVATAAHVDCWRPPEGDPDRRGPPTDERAAFLHYYSPIILKQSSEADGTAGRDWITNFYFDRDEVLSNNRESWMTKLKPFVECGHPPLRIRPTLYTHAIQFEEGETRSLVLVYHIYHAIGEGEIHDWERFEIRLDAVRNSPGNGETVRYAVVTQHSLHRAARRGDLHWYKTDSGKHPLLWQSSWDVSEVDQSNPIRGAELHFVRTPARRLRTLFAKDKKAQVEIDGRSSKVAFHYVFVDEADSEAVSFWNAETISGRNADTLVAGSAASAKVRTSEVKRIRYQLQDTADILPTHLKLDDEENTDWEAPELRVRMPDGLRDERGDFAVEPNRSGLPSEMYVFLTQDVDVVSPSMQRKGYPGKHWFWGAYLFDRLVDAKGHFVSKAYRFGTPGSGRGAASGFEDAHGLYWYQHDYFAHSGVRAKRAGGADSESVRGDGELGSWLPQGWHTPEKQGFDGRWIQLFPDGSR